MKSNQMFEGERKDQEWIKNWLSFLPEIKQEIQSFLELPQNATLPSGVHRSESTPFRELANNIMPFSRLQECLARLDRLPYIEDILNETDSTKLRLIRFSKPLPTAVSRMKRFYREK